MKKALLTVVSLAAFVLFAEEAKKPADPMAPAAKPQAQTKATPKAAAKKAAKKPGFQAYDAGEWKPVDNRKGYLYGYQLSDGDLRHQPVLIVKFDPDVEVDNDKRESDPRYIYQFMGWEVKVQPHLEVVNVPSRPLTKDDLPKLKKLAGSTAAIPGFPWYQDVGLVKEPENPGGAYPFYYVVSAAGQVIYAGNRGSDAKSYVYGDLKKCGDPDPMLGFVKPKDHEDLCSKLKFGTNCMAEEKKLRLLAAKGTDESKAEAQAILDALEQTQTYVVKSLLAAARSEPQQALVLADEASKTFPRGKTKFSEAVATVKNNPTVKTTLQLYRKLAALKLRLEDEKAEPMKKADLTKAYQDALKGERLCNKFRKAIGENGAIPPAVKAFEDIVQTVKALLEAQGAGAK